MTFVKLNVMDTVVIFLTLYLLSYKVSQLAFVSLPDSCNLPNEIIVVITAVALKAVLERTCRV